MTITAAAEQMLVDFVLLLITVREEAIIAEVALQLVERNVASRVAVVSKGLQASGEKLATRLALGLPHSER